MSNAGNRLSMTRGGPVLTLSPHARSGGRLRYSTAKPIQVGPQTAMLVVGREAVGGRALDFADGAEAILFDRLDRIDPVGALVLSENEEDINPHNGERVLMIKFPTGGFVPLGARMADGSPHPHAGSGFLITVTHGLPLRLLEGGTAFDGRWAQDRDLFRQLELLQMSFDGSRVAVTRRERMGFKELLPGVTLFNRGFSAVPDGEDLLFAMQGAPGADDRQWATKVGCGCLRWRRGAQGWRPIDFAPATGEINAFEPSMIRDRDGALLMTARQTGADVPEKFSVFIWRSADNGRTWTRILDRPRTRAESPVTLNVAPDGTPFIAANLLTPNLTPRGGFGYWREILALWPLSEDRLRLEKPAIARCASFEWGPALSDYGWNVDHPISGQVQLADGRCRTVLCYRVMDRGETAQGLPPTPMTGCYVEEILA